VVWYILGLRHILHLMQKWALETPNLEWYNAKWMSHDHRCIKYCKVKFFFTHAPQIPT
jgi:hypothetical protein